MNKFDSLCNLILENCKPLTESREKNIYGLNPEFDVEKLTGMDGFVANFVSEKPATAEEIVTAVQNNSADPEEAGTRSASIDVFKELVDSGILILVKSPEISQAADVEAAESDLADAAKLERAVSQDNVEDTTIDSVEGDIDTEETQEQPIPTLDTEDEENTFATFANKDETDNMIDDDDDVDDTPISVLRNREKKQEDGRERRRIQREKLARYLMTKRGKSPEEIDAGLARMRTKGLF